MVNSTIVNVKKAPKKQDLRLPRDFRYFDDLIQDNINCLNIEKQINKDALKYAPINILNNNSSMSVIIHKKKRIQSLRNICMLHVFPQ